MPRLIWVFAGRTGHFVGFVVRWLIYLLISDAVKTLVGEENARRGTIKMFEVLQDVKLNKHLFYVSNTTVEQIRRVFCAN